MKIIFKVFLKIYQVIDFLFFYLKELITANIFLAYDIITPKDHFKPGIIEVPLDVKTDAEVLTLVNLTSMTPGSLSLDIADDKSKLYIHAMYLDDPEVFREKFKGGLEKKVLEVYKW